MTFVDGTRVTPGTAECKCDDRREWPCWQHQGLAEACTVCGCPPLDLEAAA